MSSFEGWCGNFRLVDGGIEEDVRGFEENGILGVGGSEMVLVGVMAQDATLKC